MPRPRLPLSVPPEACAAMTTARRPQAAGTAPDGLGVTRRRDRWWVAPGVQALVFTICATYLGFSGVLWNPLGGPAFEVDGYLSPLFSPHLFQGQLPWFISPGLLILWIPLGFRATCYYYRKAYYRFYFADPPGCAVGEPSVHRGYKMETAFPVHPPKPPPLLPLPRVHPAVLPLGRRRARQRSRRAAFGSAWACRPVRERRASDGLLAVVPFAPPHRRWAPGLLLVLAPDPSPLQRCGSG